MSSAETIDTRGALFTIGHSTRPLPDFIDLLRAHRVDLLIDVRSVPRSRHNPQFNTDPLARALADDGIDYRRHPRLGGFRRPAPDSKNTAWRNESFRGYADYMGTEPFANALDEVIATANSGKRVALMCAEGAPSRCHRSLIADALLARGLPVAEITSTSRAALHRLTAFAYVHHDGRVTYPG